MVLLLISMISFPVSLMATNHRDNCSTTTYSYCVFSRSMGVSFFFPSSSSLLSNSILFLSSFLCSIPLLYWFIAQHCCLLEEAHVQTASSFTTHKMEMVIDSSVIHYLTGGENCITNHNYLTNHIPTKIRNNQRVFLSRLLSIIGRIVNRYLCQLWISHLFAINGWRKRLFFFLCLLLLLLLLSLLILSCWWLPICSKPNIMNCIMTRW